MTWVTERVVAGEIASAAEARMAQLEFNWSWAQTPKLTGSYAAETNGPGAGLGHYFGSATSIRMGYWFSSRGWVDEQDMKLVFATRVSDDPGVDEIDCFQIKLDWTSHAIGLWEYYDSLGGYIHNQSNYDIRALLGRLYDWQHHSLFYEPSTGTVKFWVNGELFIDSTLTVAEEAKFIYAAAHGNIANSGGLISIDDLYFDSSTISESSTIPPARRYYNASPDGAGNYSQWTPLSGSNYQNVDDVGAPDDDSTYVSSGSDSEIDTYTFSALVDVYPDITIDGAVVQAYCRTSPLDGIASIKLRDRLSGVDDESDAKRVFMEKKGQPSGETFWDWCVLSGWFPTDPSSATWTESNFNSAEFGIESSGII